MRHHPTFDGALMAQNSLRHHHRAPTPWGGGAAHRHYPHWRWRTDGAMTHRWQPNLPHAGKSRYEKYVFEKDWARLSESEHCTNDPHKAEFESVSMKPDKL